MRFRKYIETPLDVLDLRDQRKVHTFTAVGPSGLLLFTPSSACFIGVSSFTFYEYWERSPLMSSEVERDVRERELFLPSDSSAVSIGQHVCRTGACVPFGRRTSSEIPQENHITCTSSRPVELRGTWS